MQSRAVMAAERAADAAAAANWISVAGIILSFVSAVFVFVALWLSWSANKMTAEEIKNARREAASLARETASALAQAKRSADASTRQSEVAGEALALEFRPYVLVRALSLVVQSETGQPFTQVILHNIGRGVALSCKVFGATEISDWMSPNLGQTSQVGGGGSHLMPNEPIDLPIRSGQAFTPSEIGLIEAGNPHRMWTHGRVEYGDEKGGMHVTHFAFAYSGGKLVRAADDNQSFRYESPLELPTPT